jgi:hypothetical protein
MRAFSQIKRFVLVEWLLPGENGVRMVKKRGFLARASHF